MQEPGSQSSLGPQGVASGSATNLLEPVAMFCDNSNGMTSTTRLMSLQEEDEAAEEDMVTSTPAPPAMEDKEKWKTPNRRYISNFGGISVVGNASSASVGNNSLGSASKSHPSRTPSSGPRTNPFDSHLSVDRLHLPTCSPSVFSIVVSPSQEEVRSKAALFSVCNEWYICNLPSDFSVDIRTVLVARSASEAVSRPDLRKLPMEAGNGQL